VGSTLLAMLAAVLIVVTCVLGARVTGAVASVALSTRRAREVVAVVLVGMLAALTPLLAVMASMDWGSQGLPIVRRIAAVLTWTPLGAAWSLPGDLAIGRGAQVPLKLLIATAFIAALWLLWRMLVARMVTSSQREASPRRYSGLGWFERLPATPAGAIAARSMSYWNRDARYRVGLAVIPVVPLIMIGALLIAGVPLPLLLWLPVPVMCLFLGWTVHNDVAHDSTAFWVHISANVSGAADRWGRLAPALAIGIPLVLVGCVATSAIWGNWPALPGLIGLSACLLLFGLGVSSVMSATFPYPAVHPGDSPFAQPQAAAGTGSVVQSLSFSATVLSAAPVAVLAFLGETLSPVWHFAALGAGLIIGGGALAGGVFLGGRILTRRAPELLAFTLQN
jgi:ABC-2 type transport system permease protein